MVKMTAETLTVVVMVTASMTGVSAEKCPKLDPVLWDYPSCPHRESAVWNLLKLKKNCDKDLDYHCASNSQGCDVQQCVKRVYCEAGQQPLLDPDKDTAVCVPCPPDRYQRTGFWSDERSYCEHKKTQCDGNDQIECQPGSATTDRSCRCDIHQNLALQSYALHNATCCTTDDPWCYCVNFKSPCPNGTVRHDNYRCLQECPPNHFRRWDSETCFPYSTTVKVEMTTSTVKNITEYNQMTTTTHQTLLFGSTGSPDTVNVGVVVGLIIVGILVLVCLMVCLWVHCRVKKRKKDAPKDEEQAMSTQEQISGKGKRTVNGHIDGSEPVDRANGHLAHVEVNSEVQEASSVSEEEATEKDHLLQSPGAETGPSTKGIGREDLRENEISNEGKRVGDKSVEALLHPLQKEMRGGKVIVQKFYKDCVIISKDTNTNIHDGTGNTFNIGKKHRTKTTIHENPVTVNEDTGSFESMKSTNGRSSSVGENPDSQLNSHSYDNLPQQKTQEEDTESLFIDTESEHRPVEHEEVVEQHMAELKLRTGNDQSRMPEEISMIGRISEETIVKVTQTDPHESMEEVRPEEVQRPIQDDDNCSDDETKKKDFFSL